MYFAKLDFNFRVQKVIVSDSETIDNLPGMYVECDINGISPKNYPGIGFQYDRDLNAFIPPKPYPSWILNSDCLWEAPVALPDGFHSWNEATLQWEEIIPEGGE